MNEQNDESQKKINELPAFLQPLVDRLHSAGRTETIFGPSRQERGRTIVPVGRVSFGFGGGSGSAAGKKRKSKGVETSAVEEERPTDEGTGGGGGIGVTPVGVFEVTDAGTRFVPVTKSKVVAVGTFLAGLFVGILVGRGTQT